MLNTFYRLTVKDEQGFEVKFLTRTAQRVRHKPQMKNQNNPRAAEMSGNNKPCFIAQKNKTVAAL